MIKNVNILLINLSYSNIDFYSKLGRTFPKLKFSNNGIALRANRNRSPKLDVNKLLLMSVFFLGGGEEGPKPIMVRTANLSINFNYIK